MIYKVGDLTYAPSDGEYIGRLAKVAEVTVDYGKSLKFIFKIEEDSGAGFFASGLCNLNLVPGSRLYKWLSILNNANLEIGEMVDVEQFVGAVVEMLVVNVKKNGRTFSNVKQIIRLVTQPNIENRRAG